VQDALQIKNSEQQYLHSMRTSRFKAGFFAIRQKAGSFNGVWSDMATEKTVIKNSKSNGGIARCASNKKFRTAISSFHEDISPVKVSKGIPK
jgi:hypothetical protein